MVQPGKARIRAARGGGWGGVWIGTGLYALAAVAAVLTHAGRAREDAPLHTAHPTADEIARGRTARTPGDIPALGWRDIAWRVYTKFFDDRVLSVAAGVTFYTLLAVFPALAAFISLYGLFFDPTNVRDQLEAAAWVLPSGAIEVLRDQSMRVIQQRESTLSISFFIGLGTALISANAGAKALIDALNVAYEEKERRSFLHLNLVGAAFTIGGILLGIVALALVVASPIAIRLLHLETSTEWVIALLRWPLLAAFVSAAATVLYRFGPCRARARWKWVSWGTVTAAVLWLAVSALFSWYVASFGNYADSYGSLGAVMGFMTWIWLSAAVMLLGAELNAEIEHQTAVDTTTGTPEPMGSRGARMADTIGAPQ